MAVITVKRWLMVGVLLWATALRFLHLGHESLWYDEIRMVIQISGSLQNTLALIRQGVQHPPAFHLLLNLFNRPIGTSDFAVRLLPAFLGVATVAATFSLGREVAGPRTGLVAAAILATLPYHVKYSQEARMYVALCFLATVAMYLLLAAARRHPASSWQLWTGWVLVNGLLLYTHYYGVFVLAAEGLVMVWWMARDRRRRSLWRRWGPATALVTVLFSPWVPVMLRQPHATSPLPYSHAYGMILPVLTIGRFFVGKPFHLWALAVASLVLLAAGSNGWLAYRRGTNRPNTSAGLEAMVILALFPIAAAWVVSFWRPIFLPRGLLVTVPPLVVLLSYALVHPWRLGGRWMRLGAALALSLVLADGLHTYYTAPQKDRWRETAATVSANQQPDDLIWVMDSYIEQGFDYYFTGEKRYAAPSGTYVRAASANVAALDRLLEGHERLWLVRTEEGESFEQFLRQGYGRAHLLQAWDFPAEMTFIHLRLFDINGEVVQ